MSLPFVTLDVFTSQAYTGNPLAIVFLAEDDLPTSQKQRIAREFNFSETVFVHPGGTNKRRITIFTTDQEIPFAGHPTIGTSSWFLCHSPNSEDQAVDTLHMKAGYVPITVARNPNSESKGTVSAKVAHNVRIHSARFPVHELLAQQPNLAAFFPDSGTETEGSHAGFPVVSIVNGMSQVHVELPSLAALEAVGKSVGGETVSVTRYLDQGWQNGHIINYFFVRDVSDSQSGKTVIRTRAILGSLEDPATGSAASGLAAYFSLQEGKAGTYRYDIVQGVEMGRRSEIGVEVDVNQEKAIERVELTGAAVKVSEGKIRVPDV